MQPAATGAQKQKLKHGGFTQAWRARAARTCTATSRRLKMQPAATGAQKQKLKHGGFTQAWRARAARTCTATSRRLFFNGLLDDRRG